MVVLVNKIWTAIDFPHYLFNTSDQDYYDNNLHLNTMKNARLPYSIFFCLMCLLQLTSCKQDPKVEPTEIKEGYYELERLETFEFPADSTPYLKDALFSAQFYSKPAFIIRKSLKNRNYTLCVAENEVKDYCNIFNCTINMVYYDSDSLYIEKPKCYVYGFREKFQPEEPYGPRYFVDSTLKYQVSFSYVKIAGKQDLTGLWKETVQCKYSTKNSDGSTTIDSIVDRPIFVRFKLKYISNE